MYEVELPIRQLEMYGHRLERTAKMMKLYFSRALASSPDIDITVDQYVVLTILNRNEELTQLDIAKASYKDAPTITRILDILTDKGYVKRETDENDRRKFIISITPGGKKIFKTANVTVNDFRQMCYNNISEEKLDVFAECLDTIFDNLTNNNNGDNN